MAALVSIGTRDAPIVLDDDDDIIFIAGPSRLPHQATHRLNVPASGESGILRTAPTSGGTFRDCIVIEDDERLEGPTDSRTTPSRLTDLSLTVPRSSQSPKYPSPPEIDPSAPANQHSRPVPHTLKRKHSLETTGDEASRPPPPLFPLSSLVTPGSSTGSSKKQLKKMRKLLRDEEAKQPRDPFPVPPSHDPLPGLLSRPIPVHVPTTLPALSLPTQNAGPERVSFTGPNWPIHVTKWSTTPITGLANIGCGDPLRLSDMRHPLPRKPGAAVPPNIYCPSGRVIGKDASAQSSSGTFPMGPSPTHEPSCTLVLERLPRKFRTLDFVLRWCRDVSLPDDPAPLHVTVLRKLDKALVEFATPGQAMLSFSSPRLVNNDGRAQICAYWLRPRDDVAIGSIAPAGVPDQSTGRKPLVPSGPSSPQILGASNPANLGRIPVHDAPPQAMVAPLDARSFHLPPDASPFPSGGFGANIGVPRPKSRAPGSTPSRPIDVEEGEQWNDLEGEVSKGEIEEGEIEEVQKVDGHQDERPETHNSVAELAYHRDPALEEIDGYHRQASLEDLQRTCAEVKEIQSKVHSRRSGLPRILHSGTSRSSQIPPVAGCLAPNQDATSGGINNSGLVAFDHQESPQLMYPYLDEHLASDASSHPAASQSAESLSSIEPSANVCQEQTPSLALSEGITQQDWEVENVMDADKRSVMMNGPRFPRLSTPLAAPPVRDSPMKEDGELSPSEVEERGSISIPLLLGGMEKEETIVSAITTSLPNPQSVTEQRLAELRERVLASKKRKPPAPSIPTSSGPSKPMSVTSSAEFDKPKRNAILPGDQSSSSASSAAETSSPESVASSVSTPATTVTSSEQSNLQRSVSYFDSMASAFLEDLLGPSKDGAQGSSRPQSVRPSSTAYKDHKVLLQEKQNRLEQYLAKSKVFLTQWEAAKGKAEKGRIMKLLKEEKRVFEAEEAVADVALKEIEAVQANSPRAKPGTAQKRLSLRGWPQTRPDQMVISLSDSEDEDEDC